MTPYFRFKVVRLEDLAAVRRQYDGHLLGHARTRCVVTNGCFDVVHAGHVEALAQARAMGEVLIVGINGDAAVRQLKGPARPVNREEHRALLLAAFEFVDVVTVFHSTTATEFLRLARPDVYVKSGDYTLETLNPEERAVLQAVGAEIIFVPLLEGLSSTRILAALSTK